MDVLIHCAGPRDQPLPPGQAAARVRPRLRREGRRLVQPAQPSATAELGAAVVFSSIAGRFGNAGQTDYAAANDLLCKSISRLRTTRPATRGIAIDWTAWAEHRHGEPRLDPEDDGDGRHRHAAAASRRSGGPARADRRRRRRRGRWSPARSGVLPRSATRPAGSTPTRRPRRCGAAGADDRAPPRLSARRRAHRADRARPGRQAVPRRPPDRRHPGAARRDGDRGVRRGGGRAAARMARRRRSRTSSFSAPFKFYRDEPRTLELQALPRDGGDGTLVADCRLVGRRALPGRRAGDGALHRPGASWRASCPPPHGRAAPAGERRGRRGGSRGDLPHLLPRARLPGARAGLAQRRRSWSAGWPPDLPPDHEPAGEPTEVAPRLIELCFQTAGVWELGTEGRMAPADPRGPDRPLRRRRAPGRAVRASSPARTDRRRCRGGGRGGPRPGPARGLSDDRAAGRARRRGARADPRRDGIAGCSDVALDRPLPPARDRQPGEPAMRAIRAVRELNEEGRRPDHPDRALHRARGPGDVRPRVRRGLLPGPGGALSGGRRRKRRIPRLARSSGRCRQPGRRRLGRLGLRRRASGLRRALRAARDRVRRARPRGHATAGRQGRAKRLAEEAGVPVAPWSGGAVERSPRREQRRGIGYPLMIKARRAAGGAGSAASTRRTSSRRRSRSARAEARTPSGTPRSCSRS